MKDSFARSAMLVMRRKSIRKSARATVTPMKPSSSPTTAKMKSVCCSGRNASRFCGPARNPLPNSPPEPIALVRRESFPHHRREHSDHDVDDEQRDPLEQIRPVAEDERQ